MLTVANPNIARLIQERLNDLGHNPGKVDGDWGSKTEAAFERYVATRIAKPAPISRPGDTIPPADERSERQISTLVSELQPLARQLVHLASAAGTTIKVISALRTYAEQDALYAKGRTAPGPKVTNARAGFSNHNFGTAFDIGIFRGATYVPESPDYKRVAAIGKSLGLEWGGDWHSFKDEPHYELRPAWAGSMTSSQILAEYRRRKAAGTPLLA